MEDRAEQQLAAGARKALPARLIHRAIIILIIIGALAVRAPLLDGPRFHPDEALFGSFARSIAVWRDPLLATAPVDKPPLLFYLQALFYPMLGPREMAARMPTFFASALTVVLTYACGVELFGRSAANRRAGEWFATAAAVLVGFSPLAVAFGATAFTDSVMLAWCLAAVLAALRQRPGWSGLLLGLGLATKYQAILFLPLVIGLMLWANREVAWGRWLLGLLAPVGMVVFWDLARGGGLQLWAAQARGYGGVRLASTAELLPRLDAWWELVQWSSGGWWLPAAWGAGLIAWLVTRIRRGRRESDRPLDLLAAWLLAYGLLHWLVTVQTWDRYLLPLVPVAALLAAGWLARWQAAERKSFGRPFIVVLMLLAFLIPTAVPAAQGALPLGGDHGLYDGIQDVAVFFDAYPYGTVLYDHWLSWELRYYLFDSRVYVSWFPDAGALREDLQAFGSSSPRFLVVPAWESNSDIRSTLQPAGYHLDPVLDAARADGTISFHVYQIAER